MPQFQIFNQIPGVQVLEPIELGDGGSGTVKLRLTDGVLWMPEDEEVVVTGTYSAANLALSATFAEASGPAFLNNQLRLTELALSIAVTDATDGSGAKVVDTGLAEPVTATGKVRWESDMVALLKGDDGGIDFAVSYAYGAGGQSAFELALEQPVPLDRVPLRLESGLMRVRVLPEEAALMVTLAGAANLVADGGLVMQITDVLEQIFGTDVPSLDPPEFVFQRKFQLSGNLPGNALELPELSLLPNWSNGATPAIDAVEGVDVSVGRPRFSFQLPDLGSPLPALALSLENSTIRLPVLPGWDDFDIIGNLDFESDADGGWHFRVEPVPAGMVSLPDFVRWLLEQLRWPALEWPFLEDLAGTLLSLAENEWYQLFEGLLDVPDPETFKTAFNNLISAALATTPFPINDLFALAFRALQPKADALYPLLWENWLGRLTGAFEPLLTLLRATVDSLSPDNLATLFDTLFAAIPSVQLDGLLEAVMEWGASSVETAFDTFLKLWLPLVASAIRVLDPNALADAIWQVMKDSTGELAEFRSLTELPAFGLPALATPDLFRVRTDVLLIGSALQGLALRSPWLEDALVFSDTGRFFDQLAQPFRNFLGLIFPVFPQVETGRFLGLLLAFFDDAEGDEASETLILQFGRFYFLGVLMALVGAAWNAVRPNHLVPWARLLFKNIEEESDLEVERLDPPGKDGRKYLIFSDIHRDEAGDDRGSMNFGSIHHFSVHKDLYLNLLEYADGEGYTVIEAGDGEELWFVRDFARYPADQRSERLLQDIIETHRAIYDKQAAMHTNGRFYRLIGNHDSQLRAGPVRAKLDEAIGQDGTPFKLYDYLVIPQVKTMDDGLLDTVLALRNASSPEDLVEILGQELIFGRIGLDSEPYTARKPLIVTHGHQWDFWNCDANNLVGKLFANTVGVTFDMLNDPFTDMGGFNYGGTALVNFRDILADLFVFNNFPTHVPARRFAHTIQHMRERDRFPVDDIMYIETLPALMSYLAMPLNQGTYDDQGNFTLTRTWTQFLANPAAAPFGAFEHLFNQLCIGHTHYPQAAPYFDIEAMLSGPIGPILDHIRGQIADRFFGIEPTLNLVKSRYYNSGNAGWHEGVIWAVEINEHGEARLVYWTEDTQVDRPQTMDWQLPRMDDDMRQTLADRKEEVELYLTELVQTLGQSLIESARNIGTAASLPLAMLAGLAKDMNAFQVNISDFSMLGSADLASDAARAHLAAQHNQLTGWLITLFLRLMERNVSGGASQEEAFELAVPLPDAIAGPLAKVEGFLDGLVFPDGSSASGRLTELACIWLLANHGASILNRAGRGGALLRTDFPVAWMVMSLVAMLPTAGDDTLPLSASATTETNNGTTSLKLAVTIR